METHARPAVVTPAQRGFERGHVALTPRIVVAMVK
jgi:hypothetical protein